MALDMFHISTKCEFRLTFLSKVVAHFLFEHWPREFDLKCASSITRYTVYIPILGFLKPFFPELGTGTGQPARQTGRQVL